MDRELPGIIEDAGLKLSGVLRTLLSQLKVELDQLAERIAAMDRIIQQTASEHGDANAYRIFRGSVQ